MLFFFSFFKVDDDNDYLIDLSLYIIGLIDIDR